MIPVKTNCGGGAVGLGGAEDRGGAEATSGAVFLIVGFGFWDLGR